MVTSIIFAISGLVIVFLIHSKVAEEKKSEKPLMLRLVSMGDDHIRQASSETAHRYTEFKSRADFFLNKQLPLHTKNFVNKTNTVIKERVEKHVGDIRGSRLLKKSDGISEFFKAISEKENDVRIDGSEGGEKENVGQ